MNSLSIEEISALQDKVAHLEKELAKAKVEIERLVRKSDLAWRLHRHYLKQEQLEAAQQQVKLLVEGEVDHSDH